jgi:hypothetical protein
MIPYLLGMAGGYILGSSIKSTFAKGGKITGVKSIPPIIEYIKKKRKKELKSDYDWMLEHPEVYFGFRYNWGMLPKVKRKELAIEAGVSKDLAHDMAYKAQDSEDLLYSLHHTRAATYQVAEYLEKYGIVDTSLGIARPTEYDYKKKLELIEKFKKQTFDNGGNIKTNILTLEMKSLLKQNSDVFGVGDFDADEMESGYGFTQEEFNYVIDDSNSIDDVINNLDKNFNIESRDMVLEILSRGGGVDKPEISIHEEGKTIKVYYVKGDIGFDGRLLKYHSGRAEEYEFEPTYFNDKESEEYFDNNWEKVEEEILNEFYEYLYKKNK